MEVKIKQGSEMLDATIEMVDGVMVVSPKEVKFEPKDGEIVTVTTKSDMSYTCFFKGYVNGCIYSYGGLSYSLNRFFDDDLVCCSKQLETIYPATEEEKKKLFDKLKEEGYEWKAETKELVKLKWKPSMYDPYYIPFYETCEFIPMGTNWNGRNKDNIRYNKGLCFKIEEECQEFCNRLNSCISSIKP